jgi:hypothetical protein
VNKGNIKITELRTIFTIQNISTITAPDIKPNPKKLFSFLKATRKETTGVPPLKHQGKTSNDTIDKANALNNQFQSVLLLS